MNRIIRVAHVEDAPAFIAIKNQLSFKNIDEETTKGGFLLGTTLENYQFYIENSYCLVAEIDKQIVGFGIIFNDTMVRQSDIWQKRKEVNWIVDIENYEHTKICYFEQLAFLEGHRKLAVNLAYQLAKWAFDNHETLITTTVREPIRNLAAVPFIKACNGKLIGLIDEYYENIGAIKSDVYCIEAQDFHKKTDNHSLTLRFSDTQFSIT